LATSQACCASLHKLAARAKKKEKSCLAFTGQTTGEISTKLYKSVQYHHFMFILPACSALLHKMTTRAKNRKILSDFHKLPGDFQPNFTGMISSILNRVYRQPVQLHCKKWSQEL
jgi:hypothetical protein